MGEFLREIDRRDRVLSRLGWLMFATLAALLVAMIRDHSQVLGVNRWLKPSKFAISIGIYAWTLAWFLPYITGPRWAKSLIRWGTAVAMVVEMVCIVGQAARGTTSHFNNATQFDANVFSVMGTFILFSTALVALLLILFFFRPIVLPAAYLWGIRWGLIGVLLASVESGLMLRAGAHSVGVADGGPGLPLVNWSTTGGDLRIAHALGLHALQVLPLLGYFITRARPQWSPATQTAALGAGAAVYGLVLVATVWQASAGRPLFAHMLAG